MTAYKMGSGGRNFKVQTHAGRPLEQSLCGHSTGAALRADGTQPVPTCGLCIKILSKCDHAWTYANDDARSCGTCGRVEERYSSRNRWIKIIPRGAAHG